MFKDIREYQAESTNSLKNDILSEIRASRSETVSTIQNTMKIISDTLTTNQRQTFELQDKRLNDMNTSLNQKQDILQKAINDRLISIDVRFKEFTQQNTQLLEGIRSYNFV